MARAKPTAEELAALERKRTHWTGKYRYLRREDGRWMVFPSYVGSPTYTNPDHHLRRQVCTGLDEAGACVWKDMPDAPELPQGFEAETRRTVDEGALLEPRPPFDWRPPAYNSDTHSGGPSNFDGRMGGEDAPRIPELEGEVPNQHADALADFQRQIESVQR